MHGIARRRKEIKISQYSTRPNWQIATVSDRGKVHILSGRTGQIREMTMEDQCSIDWVPFQEKPEKTRRVKVPPPDPNRQRKWAARNRKTKAEYEAARLAPESTIPVEESFSPEDPSSDPDTSL